MSVERPVLRSWLQQMIVVPQDKRITPRSTLAALQDERRTPRSTFGAPQDERRTPRSTFVVRFTFGVPQDKRRTPRSTFGAPQERESRLHRFRPASPQQTLGSQGVVAFAVAVVAFAEGPRARPSPRSITYVMRGNLCLAHPPAPRRTPAEPSSSHGRGRRVGEEARTAPPPAPARFFLSSGKA